MLKPHEIGRKGVGEGANGGKLGPKDEGMMVLFVWKT